MKNLNQRINELNQGDAIDISSIGSQGKLYRVTDKAIQLNCVNNGMVWIPKSQIIHIEIGSRKEYSQSDVENNYNTFTMVDVKKIELSKWIEEKINAHDGTSSGAY